MLVRWVSCVSALLAFTAAAGCGGDEAYVDGFAGISGGGAANPTAVATIAPFGTGTVTGTASFTQSGTSVTVTVTLTNCVDGPHGVHIHQGVSCADPLMQGDHWDMTRGEMIPEVTCVGGTGTSTHTRAALVPTLAWSIGGDPLTNVVGHAFVVHDPGMPAPRIGCGIIAAGP